MGDNERDVRQAAAGALGQLKTATAPVIDALLKALRDSDSDVRQAAAGALGQLGSNHYELTRLRSWLLDQRLNQLYEEKLTREVTHKMFFFVDDKKSFHAIPCVSKDWKRWHEEMRQDEQEHKHRQLLGETQNQLAALSLETPEKEEGTYLSTSTFPISQNYSSTLLPTLTALPFGQQTTSMTTLTTTTTTTTNVTSTNPPTP